MVAETLELPGLGRVTVEHEPDWSGDAIVRVPDEFLRERAVSMPGRVLLALGRRAVAAVEGFEVLRDLGRLAQAS